MLVHLINSELNAIIDESDFELLSKYRWRLNNKGYAISSVTDERMHRLIMLPAPNLQIDHINHNKLDNRRINLRICTSKENSRNRVTGENNTSGFKGVCLEPRNKYKKWRAKIYYNTRAIHIGCFKTKEEAVKAYNDAAIKYFGDFAFLN